MLEELISAREYARRKGKSESWAQKNAVEAVKLGFPVRKPSGYWLMTYQEWDKLIEKVKRKKKEEKEQDQVGS